MLVNFDSQQFDNVLTVDILHTFDFPLEIFLEKSIMFL